jgi:hypothetical protein
MPANDERDPLDAWLGQQVQPLPPPPGTFELITRRARRRKVRKFAVSLAGGVAAAVAIALAVPGGLLIQLNTVDAPIAAGSTTPTSASPSESQSEFGSGSASATPSATATTPSVPATHPSGSVPDHFAPTSTTWVNTSTGWVIGQAGTPGHCANKNPNICTSVARTDNAGTTWEGGPAPKTTGPSGPVGVSQIRFLDGVNGWAFGPALWVTHDAGYTWNQIPTNGQRVTDLETAGNRAFALWAECYNPSASADIASSCTSYTLMSAAKYSDHWTPVGQAPPTNGLANQGNQTSGMIALTSTVGYLLAPDGTLFSGPLDGSAWHRVGSTPCQPGLPQPDGIPGYGHLALVDSTHLALACGSATGNGTPAIYTSDNGGAFWTKRANVTAEGRLTSFTAAPNGTLVLATTQGLYVLLAGTTSWKATNVAGTSAPTGGFTYVGMTTDTQGVAVPAQTSLHEIWMTFDGGSTWAARTPIVPGR